MLTTAVLYVRRLYHKAVQAYSSTIHIDIQYLYHRLPRALGSSTSSRLARKLVHTPTSTAVFGLNTTAVLSFSLVVEKEGRGVLASFSRKEPDLLHSTF